MGHFARKVELAEKVLVAALQMLHQTNSEFLYRRVQNARVGAGIRRREGKMRREARIVLN